MNVRELTSRHADRLIAGTLAVLYCVEIATESHFAGDRAVSYPAAFAFCAALLWRRRAPLVALVLAIVVIELSNLAAPALAETGAFLVGLMVCIYSTGRYTHGRALIVGVALVVVAIPLAAIEPGDPVAFTDIAFFAVLFGGPWVVGRYARHRSERERVLVVQRDVRAREAVAEERTRIARELHDVVAHAISLIVLQARGGRRMLSDDPDETRRALDVIEHAGEQALGEMRRLLGLLREDEPELSLAPPPSLRRIDELVAGTRASGLPVEVVIEGEPVELPPGVDVSAYRIVQEALTNALKHAGPAHARVTITYARDAVDLAIVDDSDTGQLFGVKVGKDGNAARRIRELGVDGGPFTGGDGLLIDRGELLVVQGSNADDGFPNGVVDFIDLRHGGRSGELADQRTDDSFQGPSTIARARDRYLVVNPDFATGTPPFTVTALPR